MSRTSALAIATAATVAASTLVAPAASADAPAIQSGTANWNIKASFLRYVQSSFVNSTITVTDGAEKVLADGKLTNFTLPVNAADSALDANGNGTIDLDGAVHIVGHHGAMDIRMSDFKIVVNGDKGALQADYERKGSMPGSSEPDTATGDDKPIVEFVVSDKIVPGADQKYNATFTPTSMTEFGVDIFGSSYTAGKPMEDGHVALNLAFEGAKQETNPSNTTDKPGETKPTDDGSSTGAIIGIVVAVLAVLGGLAFAATQPGVQAMINQFLGGLPF